MERRKIQIIAGTSFTVSLPKKWVQSNHLKKGDELLIYENGDKTLTMSPKAIEGAEMKDITINIDEHPQDIDHMLFVLYYMGVEEMNLFSKKGIDTSTSKRIRKALRDMSGTEVTYEDKNKISVKILLDKERVNVIQTLNRIFLLIDDSINNIMMDLDMDQIKLNEEEIDRLYHLIIKIASISLSNPRILNTSGIENVRFLPTFFLVSKRMEHIADNINYLAIYLNSNAGEKKTIAPCLEGIQSYLHKCLRGLKSESPLADSKEDIDRINQLIMKIKDMAMAGLMKYTARYLKDIDEEISEHIFYKKLLSKKGI